MYASNVGAWRKSARGRIRAESSDQGQAARKLSHRFQDELRDDDGSLGPRTKSFEHRKKNQHLIWPQKYRPLGTGTSASPRWASQKEMKDFRASLGPDAGQAERLEKTGRFRGGHFGIRKGALNSESKGLKRGASFEGKKGAGDGRQPLVTSYSVRGFLGERLGRPPLGNLLRYRLIHGRRSTVQP